MLKFLDAHRVFFLHVIRDDRTLWPFFFVKKNTQKAESYPKNENFIALCNLKRTMMGFIVFFIQIIFNIQNQSESN